MTRPATAEPSTSAAPVNWAVLDAVRGPIGLAVSGGSDSTALAVLLAERCPERIGAILTVNHGLRQEAAEDVAAVRALGRRLGLPVHTLAVSGGPPPQSGLQAWAREVRHQLFVRAAAAHGLSAVALGHTLDDQAETFLMRLARGSGLKGLGAMRPVAIRDGLTLLRPLLDCRRERLRDALVARRIGWREDPTNRHTAFTRVAIRSALPALEPHGLSADRLALTARHLARASYAIDAWVAHLLRGASTDRAGAIALAAEDYFAPPDEVRLRALAALIQRAGGKPHGPEIDALTRADAALRLPGASLTLGRVRLVREAGTLVIWREARGIQPLHLAPGERGIFDGRYAVSAAEGNADPLTVTSIGDDLARRLPQVARRAAMATAPAVRIEGRFLAAPTLGLWCRGVPRDAVRLHALRGTGLYAER